jgi:hypothetical protein
MSRSTTRQPADAASAAMPLPMAPAPTTPTVVTRIQALSVRDTENIHAGTAGRKGSV